jgi:hypothetical protein
LGRQDWRVMLGRKGQRNWATKGWMARTGSRGMPGLKEHQGSRETRGKWAQRRTERQDWRVMQEKPDSGVMREKPDSADSEVTLGRWVIHSWEKRD